MRIVILAIVGIICLTIMYVVTVISNTYLEVKNYETFSKNLTLEEKEKIIEEEIKKWKTK